MKKIKNLAISIDHNQAFAGKSKGNKHLLRVVKIAKFLAKNNKSNILVVEAGAWLHDTALPSGNDYNYNKNKKIVSKLLINTNISHSKKNDIAECVASHEGTIIPQSSEAKIVHDADVLEKIGILGVIRHAWKLTNSDKIDPNKITDKEIKHITEHIKWRSSILQTGTAKKLARRNNTKITITTLRKIIPIISKLAQQGVITEKIAVKIRPFLNSKQNQILKDQLSLNYLK